jgi:acyl carrier protein
VVIVREDIPGDQRITAYYIPSEGSAPAIGELHHYLQARLPEYMLPSSFMLLDEFPLTPNGKINRKALLAPDQTRPDFEKAFVPPRDGVEEKIASIWRLLLRIDQVGTADNFFELGGHSLLATQLISRLNESFHLNLPLRTIFETPTVAGLAERIETILWAVQGRPEESTIDPENREELEF